jgi:hypothetical protein
VRDDFPDRVVERLDPATAQHRTRHIEYEDEVERLSANRPTQSINHHDL